MPWGMKDAMRFTHKATTPKLQRTFAKVANAVLAESGDEGKAVRTANRTVGKMKEKQTRAVSRAKGH